MKEYRYNIRRETSFVVLHVYTSPCNFDSPVCACKVTHALSRCYLIVAYCNNTGRIF